MVVCTQSFVCVGVFALRWLICLGIRLASAQFLALFVFGYSYICGSVLVCVCRLDFWLWVLCVFSSSPFIACLQNVLYSYMLSYTMISEFPQYYMHEQPSAQTHNCLSNSNEFSRNCLQLGMWLCSVCSIVFFVVISWLSSYHQFDRRTFIWSWYTIWAAICITIFCCVLRMQAIQILGISYRLRYELAAVLLLLQSNSLFCSRHSEVKLYWTACWSHGIFSVFADIIGEYKNRIYNREDAQAHTHNLQTTHRERYVRMLFRVCLCFFWCFLCCLCVCEYGICFFFVSSPTFLRRYDGC